MEGAITRWGNTAAVDPARNMSAWSIWVAPATMACTRVKILRPGWKPPVRVPRRMVELHRASSPSLATTVAMSNRPALATRFGSSKVTAIRLIPRDTGFTESASFVVENYGVSNRNSPSIGGIFRGCAASDQMARRCFEAQPAPLGDSHGIPSLGPLHQLDRDDQSDCQGELGEPMGAEAVGIAPQLTEIAQP